MPRLKLYANGWLALPEGFRRKLGLESGAEIEAELVGGTIVLRPMKGSAKPEKAGVAANAAAATPVPAILAAPAAQEADQAAAAPEPASAPKRRGRSPRAKG